MNSPDEPRKRAAKQLRTRLGLSQSTFGRRIGRTLNTVLRYELHAEPMGEALLPYAALAIQCGYSDLAEIFRAAIVEDFGPDLERVMSWQPDQGSCGVHIPQDIRPLVEAFMEFMEAESLQPAEELARNSLKQLLLNEYSVSGLRLRRKSG